MWCSIEFWLCNILPACWSLVYTTGQNNIDIFAFDMLKHSSPAILMINNVIPVSTAVILRYLMCLEIMQKYIKTDFCLSSRRTLQRIYWQSLTLGVTHIARNMFTVFMCPPSWVLEATQLANGTRRASSGTLLLEISEWLNLISFLVNVLFLLLYNIGIFTLDC